ncbi:hypothetical protein CEXT_617351 [Caerostris extrusa]|uniref:Secreted protein n=1 Tax=Caerostris extrusa TaxID=172846 RepID=A0AAV4XE64_CAEEX|nr:hypothetical protein CEXT_617351 [Caerostris extrusa]
MIRNLNRWKKWFCKISVFVFSQSWETISNLQITSASLSSERRLKRKQGAISGNVAMATPLPGNGSICVTPGCRIEMPQSNIDYFPHLFILYFAKIKIGCN